MRKPDYSGWFIEMDGFRRPMVLADELSLLTTKEGRQMSLREALAVGELEFLCFMCPWLESAVDPDLDELDGFVREAGPDTPLVKFLKEELA